MKTTECTHSQLKMIGDFWTLAIIQALEKEPKRFRQLEREVLGINPATLTNRLKRLEKEVLIRRDTETVDKLSVVYSLTKKGIGILPILTEIRLFAKKFL